jgi:uncharacterized protein YbaR (Trm112 family)
MNHLSTLSAIVCPETHQALSEAGADLLSRLNTLIRAGDISNRAGDVLSDSVDAGLVREDRQLLYPVLDGIPKMIVDEAIPLEQVG